MKEDYLLMSDRSLGEFDEDLCYKIEWEINVNLIRHFKNGGLVKGDSFGI